MPLLALFWAYLAVPQSVGGLTLKLSGTSQLKPAEVRGWVPGLRRSRCASLGAAARRLIVRHYRARGYRLVRVRFHCKVANTLTVEVDEGRIGKVIVKGIGSLQGILTQFKCQLPGDIFHEKTIRKKLRALKRANKDIIRASFRLVPSAARKRSKRWDEARFDVELIIRRRRDHRLLLDIAYSSEFALLSKVGYLRHNAGLQDARWMILFRLGVDLVGAIRKESFRKFWRHAGLRSRYTFPPSLAA